MPSKKGDDRGEESSSSEDSDSEVLFDSEMPEELPTEVEQTKQGKVRDLWRLAAQRARSKGLSAAPPTQAQASQDYGKRASMPSLGLVGGRRMSAPAAQHGGAIARRASLGQAEDILKTLGGTKTMDAMEAVQESAEASKPGAEWLAKVQALEEVREKTKQFNDQTLFLFEAAGLDVSGLAPRDKIKLTENLRSETENLLQCLTKSAYDLVSNDLEELVSLRKIVAELDDKVADMNKTYLKEISMTRDRYRTPSDVVQEVAGKFDYDDKSENLTQRIEFYEPLTYLSEVVRGTVLGILDEKIKAMFSYDPTLRDRVNDFEIARFEDTMKDERLRSFEKLNSKLRDENRDFRDQINKLEKKMERSSWELVEVQKQCRRSESEKVELEKRIGESAPRCEAQTQYENPAQLDQAIFLPTISASDSPKMKKASSRTDSFNRVPSLRGLGKDVGVQVGDPEPSPRGDARPKLHRKTSFEINCEKEQQDLQNAGTKAELEIELNKTRRDFDKAKQILLQRDRVIKRLEKELEEAKAKSSSLEATAEKASARDRNSHAEEGAVSRSSTLSIEQDAINDIKMHEKLLTAQEQIVKEKERADEALCQVELLREQTRTLLLERDQARLEARKAEERRLEMLSSCAHDSESVSQELSVDVAKLAREKNALAEEVDQLKGAFSMALSRNAALEVLVASNKSELPMPKLLKRRTQESFVAENREMESLQTQRGQLREKVTVQKEQLAELVKENTILHLALEEMQQEVKLLTEQLRKVVPAIEVMDADLEACLNRMEKVVKNGGGAYVRLHKDTKLREIARNIRTNLSNNRANMDGFSDEDQRDSNQTDVEPDTSRANAKRRKEAIRSPRDSMSPYSPRSREIGAPEPPPPPGQPKRWTELRSSTEELILTTPSSSTSVMPTPRGRRGPLPSISNKRSYTQPEDLKCSPRLAPIVRGDSEERGGLVLGNRGGMAVLGGVGKAKLSGRG